MDLEEALVSMFQGKFEFRNEDSYLCGRSLILY
jgi:hypothetical protein